MTQHVPAIVSRWRIHGQGALFGIYGMKSIGVLLCSWRGLVSKALRNDGVLLPTLGTLFPVGILQTWISYKEGLRTARNPTFFEGDSPTFRGMSASSRTSISVWWECFPFDLLPLLNLSLPETKGIQGRGIGLGTPGHRTVTIAYCQWQIRQGHRVMGQRCLPWRRCRFGEWP